VEPLLTKRLILRPFRDTDVEPFAALNQDPEVMRCFPAPLSREESRALLQRLFDHHRQHGFGMLAAETREGATFVGFVGLSVVSFDAPFAPCVELVWRLAKEHWGQGFATEAAFRLIEYAFTHLGLLEVVAFTALQNVRSMAVMKRLHMRYDGEFDHPRLPPDHRLRRHVLYRVSRAGALDVEPTRPIGS
jgi:RimJ/RimL family protein N-acetyltransferase